MQSFLDLDITSAASKGREVAEEAAKAREPVPAGEYVMNLRRAELKSADGSSLTAARQYYMLEFEIESGEHKGRRIFEFADIQNGNPKMQWAVEKGFAFLACLAAAVGATGTLGEFDPANFYGSALIADVRVTGAKKDQAPRNYIAYETFRPAGEGWISASAPATPEPSPAAPPASAVPQHVHAAGAPSFLRN